ncbi:PQQ-dependent sugar dehydrogenase [Kribbella sp. NPDC003557]|uniref:PQQ-dependent sugar dehydrogenase n=1 Tax=Kribbella sp. NPDC003557 TaxID=3154449 RepID=UPI0033BDADC8
MARIRDRFGRSAKALGILLTLALAAVGLVATSSPAVAATPAHVQSRAKEVSTGTVNSLAFSAANTGGNLIVVYLIWNTSASVTMSDSRGNAYAAVAPVTRWNNNTWSSQVFYAKNIGAGANTVRATFSAAITAWADMYIHEYSGLDKANPLDVSSAAVGTTSAMNSGTATTTNASDLIFGAGASAGTVTAVGAGFTSRRSNFGNRTEDKVVSTAGPYNATATQNGASWVMHMAAFKSDSTPADTTPPTVAITSPANLATVNDIVTVSADAADNDRVAGVQFFVDGTASGSEDTASPYALTWDSRTVGNGAHTLTARARDASGNTTTSAAVNVNVTNTNYFQNEILATGFDLPTTFEFLPDGRMLVAELQGKIKVLPPPYTTPSATLFLQITNIGQAGVQQGIYDLVLDPAFTTNHYYYVFYTLGSPNHDRVSRFTANANLTGTVAGSEFVLYEDPQDANAEHHGGALNFANDGKLLFTTGEHFVPSAAPLLTSPRGKVHRINTDGTAPTDNPFYDGTGPNIDTIWARGLRNPFRAYYDPPTGRLFIGDVGGNDPATSKEEIELGARGADYGWPATEGPCPAPCTSPLLWYPHAGRDAAVTGGFVYHGTAFPPAYRGAYFYADYAQNWIRGLTLDANGAVSGTFNFEPADGSVDGPYGDIVYLAEGPDGALYYADLGYSDESGQFGVSKIRRIKYVQNNQAPVVNAAATPTSGPTPLDVSFSSAGSSDPEGQPLTYSWDFGDGASSTEANPTHTYTTAGAYQVRLTVSDGVNSSLSTPVAISAGSVPTATILSPADGARFRAGDVITYGGQGTDPDDGTLPASAFTWNIDFLHDGHVHPGTPITGVTGGTFTIPTSGHDFTGNTRYRITLTVRDSTGLTSTQSVVIWPEKVNLSFDTVPTGRTLYLDGIARTTPFVADTLVGYNHTVEARNQTSGNTSYTFASWSDGGGQQHTITVPATAQTYVATYTATQLPTGLVGAWGFNETSGTTVNDSSGSGNNGTMSGAGVTRSTAGKYGGAMSFNGSAGNVTVPNAASLSLSSSYTLEAWVNPTALSNYQTILIKEVTGGCGYWLQTTGNQIASGFANGGCREFVSTTPTVPLNQWSHVAAVFNDTANTYTLYLNGTAILTATQTLAPVPNTQALVFGQSACTSCGGERWRGLIDDIRIYNRPLSTAEIQTDMTTAIP